MSVLRVNHKPGEDDILRQLLSCNTGSRCFPYKSCFYLAMILLQNSLAGFCLVFRHFDRHHREGLYRIKDVLG